jgi:DNA-binding transcriptional LysR family regulator
MDLRELRYFVAVFEERNLTAAARRCFISQPSVSAAIKTIETELGARLFTRHKKGVTPTSAAETLYPHARRLLDEAAAVRGLFTAKAPEEAFTLGLLRSLDIARTVRLLQPISAMPGIRLKLVDAKEPADARIIEKAAARDNETFVPLWRERYVLALPARHVLAVPTPVRDDEMRDLRFIARCHCEASELLFQGGRRLRTVAVAESEEWALALVGAGLGATILPEGSVQGRSDVVVRPLASHKITRRIGVAYGAHRALTPKGWEVIAKLRSLAQAKPATALPPVALPASRARAKRV